MRRSFQTTSISCRTFTCDVTIFCKLQMQLSIIRCMRKTDFVNRLIIRHSLASSFWKLLRDHVIEYNFSLTFNKFCVIFCVSYANIWSFCIRFARKSKTVCAMSVEASATGWQMMRDAGRYDIDMCTLEGTVPPVHLFDTERQEELTSLSSRWGDNIRKDSRCGFIYSLCPRNFLPHLSCQR